MSQVSIDQKVIDARRETQILGGFSADVHLRMFTFVVVVDGNNVVLDGSVKDGSAKDLAEHIALGVDGITHVDNRISIETQKQPVPAAQTADAERHGG